MAKQQKKSLGSFDEVDRALLDIGQQMSIIKSEEANLNDATQKLREMYDKKTETARAYVVAREKEIEEFCLLNKKEFETKRTVELMHGSVGIRTQPPKVSTLNRKYSMDLVVELLEKIGLSRFVRTKKEVDKEAVLSGYASKELDDAKLSGVGLRIDQSEKFVYEIKWEAIEA